MYAIISRFFVSVLVVGFCGCIAWAIAFFILQIISSIKWPDTQYRGSRNAFGMYWHTKPDKKEEEKQRQDWFDSALEFWTKIIIVATIICIIYAIITGHFFGIDT